MASAPFSIDCAKREVNAKVKLIKKIMFFFMILVMIFVPEVCLSVVKEVDANSERKHTTDVVLDLISC